MRARGMFARSDLVYREIDKKLARENGGGDEIPPEDLAWHTFDAVTRKVIDRLHDSDIEDWDAETWKTFQQLLRMRPKQSKDIAPELKGMTVEQLKKLTSSDEA